VILAEIPYLRIDPEIVTIGPLTIRWYGVSYVLAFGLAYLVLKDLARRRSVRTGEPLWPVEPERVADVLFWGILGVFVGGRLGWFLFYAVQLPDYDVSRWWRVWEGGMSFHGGLLGVVVAYWIYTARMGKPRGQFFDGLTVATPLGILCVRLANYVNGELYGRPTDVPWAMRFPAYQERGGPARWEQDLEAGVSGDLLWTEPRHPSQLYEGLGEGLLLYVVLRWLMVRKGVGGGRISGLFLVGYGLVRFAVEFVREPDVNIAPGTGPLGFLGFLTRGQQLSLVMVLLGLVVLALCARKARRASAPETPLP
jgi:phosphatidylglycerol:prolipoprotein diacylglycerol transferase